MVLPHSRHMFVRPVLVMDQRAWTEAHVAAFGFFGGVPARLIPDNLRTGVDRADLYDPKINRSYAELAAHYGTLVDPARARKPKDKASVERPMPYVRDSFWRGREFTSLAQMQAAAVAWSADVAGQRKCRPLDGAAPAVVFAAAEAAALGPLPGVPVRPGHLVTGQGRPRHPHQGRAGAVLGAVAADRPARGRADHRHDGAGLLRRRTGQDPCALRAREAHRLRRLPAGEDRFRDAQPGLVPPPGRADRPRDRAGHRGADGDQRAAPAALRPGNPRPARQARPRPGGGSLRQGDHRRRPVLPHHQGHPGRRARNRPAAAGHRRRRRRRVPARPVPAVRRRHRTETLR